MVQSFNAKALVTLASVLRRPYLMSPHVFVNNISGVFSVSSFVLLQCIHYSLTHSLYLYTEINYEALKQDCNIRAVVFDKDNTLTAPYALEIHPQAQVGFQKALDTFGVQGVAILSNSAGTKDDVDYQDAIEIENSLHIPVIRHDEKKPGGLQEVLQHFQLEDSSQICMIGDRLLTDIVFGNLHGMLTIHTLPLCSGSDNASDNKIASSIRTIENASLYSNWFGGRMIRSRTMPHKYWAGEETCPLIISSSTSSSNGEEEEKEEEGHDDDEPDDLSSR